MKIRNKKIKILSRNHIVNLSSLLIFGQGKIKYNIELPQCINGKTITSTKIS